MPATSQNILNSLQLLQQIIRNRLDRYFKKGDANGASIFPPIQIFEDDTSIHDFIIRNKLSVEEYVTILMALAPHIQPALYENCIHEYLPQGGEFSEFGGVKGSNHRGVLPTGETVLFILCGDDLE